MNTAEMEERLRKHADEVKSAMAAPFDEKRGELYMTTKRLGIKRTILIAAAVVCLMGTTVFAAAHFLNAKEVADELGDSTLAKYFDDAGTVSDTVTDGKYKAAVLGVASGREISEFKGSSWELYPDRTYAAVAVGKADGSDMTYEDELMITPLIEGLEPWNYNIVTMHGGYTADIIDGVLYRIIECDSVEFFADKKIYLAVSDTYISRDQPYIFDEETGRIYADENYSGTNILFELELDRSKADSEKAAEYLEKLENRKGEQEDQ